MKKSTGVLSAGLLLSVLFLWLALRDTDIDQLVAALLRTNLWWAPAFVAALAAFCWIKALRWSILLKPVTSSSANQLFPPVIIGYAGTTLMPLQLGEIARAYVAARATDTRVLTVLTSIVVERVLDVLSLLVILAIVLMLGGDAIPGMQQVGLWMLGLAALALASLFAFALRPAWIYAIVAKLTAPLPAKLRHAIEHHVTAAAAGVGVLKEPSQFAALALTSAAQWTCMLACCWISLQALDLALPWTAALVVLAATLVAMSLPSAPGYLGSVQLAFWLALSPFDIAREDALAASVFYHVLICGPLLLGGILCVSLIGFRWRDLQRESAMIVATSASQANSQT
jgi:uncharacterized protein (TIRG00374 family)